MKLTVVYEQENLVVAKDPTTGQLYIGGVTTSGTRQYQKIESYSLRYNGGDQVDSYVLEDGSRVFLLEENHDPAPLSTNDYSAVD